LARDDNCTTIITHHNPSQPKNHALSITLMPLIGDSLLVTLSFQEGKRGVRWCRGNHRKKKSAGLIPDNQTGSPFTEPTWMRASPRSSSNIPSTFPSPPPSHLLRSRVRHAVKARGCEVLCAGACSSDWLSDWLSDSSLVSNSHACSTPISPDWYYSSHSA
jgi:hypothetical protein